MGSDVIAAIATPPGRGGIGIVRLSGSELTLFFEGVLHQVPTPRLAHLARFFGDHDEVIDSGIALHFVAPHSFTGEHVLELHGHGGPAVMHMLLDRCLDLGARLAEPGEFSKRAFLNGKIDLAQAESVADLIEATTATAARAAMRSLRGEFSARIHDLVKSLIELRMLTEATLDFPEEDIELLHELDLRGRLSQLIEGVTKILAQARQGALLREGLQVVLIGQPNVGKSSLLNRFAGEEVAIVTPIAGTTRDPIKQALQLRGIPLHMVDTAGLREGADAVEQLGIDRTWQQVDAADVAILVVDDRLGLDSSDVSILRRLPTTLPRIVARNKIDLSGASTGLADTHGLRQVHVSAKTGEGLDMLRDAVLNLVGGGEETGDAFIARQRHVRALVVARENLAAAGVQAEGASIPMELFAEELRLAQEHLSSITGEFSADQLLGEIFSTFCIGK